MTRRCGAIDAVGQVLTVVVCSLDAGHIGAHRCRLPIVGGHRVVEWANQEATR